MKTHVVYVLVSDHTDFFLEQVLISIFSLRKYNYDVITDLVVDYTTVDTFKGQRSVIKKYVSNIINVEVPSEYDKMRRSRYLKTNLRKFVHGDMLFIDCDTIICDSLADIDKIDAPIAMVADTNGNVMLSSREIIERCKQAGWNNLESKPYYNSGVMYAKDTPVVYEFFEGWFENWKQSSDRGVKYDQPALCATNFEKGFLIQEISGIWNCQFKINGYPFLKNAKILHYYSNNGEKNSSFTLPMDMLYQQVMDDGITPLIDKLIRHAKTDFYAVMTVNKEQSMSFFNSHLLYLYTNRPALYQVLERVGKMMERMLYR